MKEYPEYHFAGIIPARYASSRFPGKPLAPIGNRPVIHWVYEQAIHSRDLVYVATEDIMIFKAVIAFGGNAIMTSPHHPRGQDHLAAEVPDIGPA